MLDPARSHIEQAAEAPQDEFAGALSRDHCPGYIADSAELLGGWRIDVFVPVLAHRFAREPPKARSQAEAS